MKELKYNDSNSNKLPDLVSDGQESTNTNVDDQMTILYTNVKKITDHLSQTATESKHIQQTTKFINEKSEKMLSPTPLELVSSAFGKLLQKYFLDYSDDQTSKHKGFFPKQFSFASEFDKVPLPIKLFDISLTASSDSTSRENKLRLALMQNIRQAMFSRTTWSPMK